MYTDSCAEGEVRVRGTSSPMIGRVEVCIQEKWRSVCSTQWNRTDAEVICRQLGFSSYGEHLRLISTNTSIHAFNMYRSYTTQGSFFNWHSHASWSRVIELYW